MSHYILGISCYDHDAAVALIHDGVLVAAADEERFSRKKHDSSFPKRALDFCLASAGIPSSKIDLVMYHQSPELKSRRILRSILQGYPRTARLWGRSLPRALGLDCRIADRLSRELGIDAARVRTTKHHRSHAASAFYCSGFPEAAVLTVDGVGESATATISLGTAGPPGAIKMLRELHFPHSLGLLYSCFTAFLGFEVNEGEYKMMGLSVYGKPRFIKEIETIAHVYPDGSLWLDMRYFDYGTSEERMFSRRFEELFGAPRPPGAAFMESTGGDLLPAEQRYADIAASVQALVERAMVKMAIEARRLTGASRLCLAGGVALNGLANASIVREAGFREVFIQPAAGDSGCALGAALHGHCEISGGGAPGRLEHAFWGKGYTDEEVSAAFSRYDVVPRRFDDDGALAAFVAERVAGGAVAGWFQGRFEWGPRALGNRSILADPRRREMKHIVNEKIKFREGFRPFAPSILEERSGEYFDGIEAVGSAARYMLLVLPVRSEKREQIPAVCHGGTGRVQLVSSKTNPKYHALISAFADLTGVPLLLNTSMNVRGEPLVASPDDALKTFLGSGLDMLVMHRWVATKVGT